MIHCIVQDYDKYRPEDYEDDPNSIYESFKDKQIAKVTNEGDKSSFNCHLYQLSFCSSIYTSIDLPIYLSINHSIYLSIYLSIFLSIYLSILFFHLYFINLYINLSFFYHIYLTNYLSS